MHRKQKLILLTSLGSMLEYYDFIIYGMMTIYLSAIFFPNNLPEIAYLKSFSVLSIGYLARPLGGYCFGVVSDLYGRKKALILAMLLMAGATLMIGFLPSYKTAGLLAPVLLIVARFLQGLSFGIEIPSMTTLIREHNQDNQRAGKYFGFIMSSTGLGAVLASLMVFLITRYFNQDEIVAWAWRIPFLLGSLLALFIIFVRGSIDETPVFIQNKDKALLHDFSKQIRLDLCKNNWKGLLSGMSITLFFSFLIIFSLYIPVYLSQYFHYSIQDIFSIMTPSIFMSILLSPIFGQWFDKLDRFQFLKITLIVFLAFLIYSLQILQSGSKSALIFFLFGYQVIIGAYATNIMTILPDIFPAQVRTTGIGICYNMAYALASLSPVILTSIIQPQNYEWVVIVFSVMMVSISFIGSHFLQSSIFNPNQMIGENTR